MMVKVPSNLAKSVTPNSRRKVLNVHMFQQNWITILLDNMGINICFQERSNSPRITEHTKCGLLAQIVPYNFLAHTPIIQLPEKPKKLSNLHVNACSSFHSASSPEKRAS
jgi:hypothetical protein